MSVRTRLAVSAVLAVWTIASPGCGGGAGSFFPSAARATAVPYQSPPVDPDAVSLELNKVATGVLHADDRCAAFSPLDTEVFPCQSYRVTIPSPGPIRVHLTWSEPDRTLCALTDRGWSCKAISPLDATSFVPSGSFAFSVGFEGSGPALTLTPDMVVDYSVSVSQVDAASVEHSR
jgi:hypothetical protein